MQLLLLTDLFLRDIRVVSACASAGHIERLSKGHLYRLRTSIKSAIGVLLENAHCNSLIVQMSLRWL